MKLPGTCGRIIWLFSLSRFCFSLSPTYSYWENPSNIETNLFDSWYCYWCNFSMIFSSSYSVQTIRNYIFCLNFVFWMGEMLIWINTFDKNSWFYRIKRHLFSGNVLILPWYSILNRSLKIQNFSNFSNKYWKILKNST